ncbi:NAD-dependent epimerase/dehydratase [Macrophomina phaseolina MS6]|uniref:NAD-dependent epimerase/dehydratase n=2 Tax=Macrophomina phaseolina TaxID=35725 RepID=K2SAS3_MACPH|nr:NAD-dependent epimerase/dehydratase [Macrophomina phaseolina MS6]KAH7052205.1 putative nucleoside-diphosphate-sugar epimerase [Macrophomina phaseolina]
MAPNVFITGTTGYIGGDALYALHSKHPDWNYTALVRTKDKGSKVTAAYPSVDVVYGDLDSYDLIKEQAAKADIVVHTADASDHVGAANAIADGLASGHSKDHPGYWLHTSGTGILCFADSDADRYGEASDKVYDDLDKVEELTGLPDHAFHRNVDQIVLNAGTKNRDSVKTAILCPPTIYGPGRGPVSGRSRQVYELTKITLQQKKGPIIGAGKTYWNNVHVHDLSDLFVLLAEAAAAGNNDPELWGEKGYFLAENGEHIWGELSKLIASEAAKAGYIPAPETFSLNKDEAWELADFQALSWGLNSRGKARRARKFLGWSPKAPSLEQEVPGIVKSEYELLQKA